MAWIALVGDGYTWAEAALSARRKSGTDRPMWRGSLMLEATVPSPKDSPVLLRLDRPGGAQGVISVHWVPGTGIDVIVTQRDQVFRATLPVTQAQCPLRISYAWDLDLQRARLAVEDTQTGAFDFAWFATPLPLFLSDFWSLPHANAAQSLPTGVAFLAVSEAVEPIGPTPSLLPDTRLDGRDGPCRLCDLALGDVLRTYTGALVPVLAVVTRKVPAAGSFRPWSLTAPALGLSQALTVGANQCLVLPGRDDSPARVAAQDLPSRCARRQSAKVKTPLVTYCQVVLPEADTVLCQGVGLDSLNIGTLARNKAHLAETLLADIPRVRLPEHATPTRVALHPAELRRVLGRDAA